jgi:hypothetical protein
VLTRARNGHQKTRIETINGNLKCALSRYRTSLGLKIGTSIKPSTLWPVHASVPVSSFRMSLVSDASMCANSSLAAPSLAPNLAPRRTRSIRSAPPPACHFSLPSRPHANEMAVITNLESRHCLGLILSFMFSRGHAAFCVLRSAY